MPSFMIDRLYEGTRLDQFLVERCLVYSRNEVQHMIDAGNVTVNGKQKKSHYKIKFKDHVEYKEPEKRFVEPAPKKRNTSLPAPRVVEETPHYFILDKPAGWMMHQATGKDNAPLISDFVLDLDPTLSVVGDNPELRPGIVHRLDKDVSGLIVIARTQSFFDHVKQQFIKRSVKKTYKALVFGHPVKEEDDIQFRIARSRRFARMAAIPQTTPDGKTATSHFVVEERFQHSTLLTVWVTTGRTNQIRVHLAAYNIPIVGDVVYGKRTPANEKVGRVLLHADYLSLYDLKGDFHEWHSPLPAQFAEYVEKARSNMAKTSPTT